MNIKKNELIFLGTGTSTGIPIIGCDCKVCCSLDSKDQRTRTSCLIKSQEGISFLIDTSPDLRTQLLREKIAAIDFSIITHTHADHLHGIDDLRPFCFGLPGVSEPHSLAVYTTRENCQDIKLRFPYIFNRRTHFHKTTILGGGSPIMHLEEVKSGQMKLHGLDFEFFKVPHGSFFTLGFLFRGLAYIVDCHEIPKNIIEQLQGRVKILIIDCLQEQPHRTHLNREKCFHYIREIQPDQSYLIHMNHEFSHQGLSELANKSFNGKVFVSYDGLRLNF